MRKWVSVRNGMGGTTADAAEEAEDTTGAATAEEGTGEDAVTAEAVVSTAAGSAGRAKCIRLSAATAARNAKCPSNQQKEGPYTAGTASRSTSPSTENHLIAWLTIAWHGSHAKGSQRVESISATPPRTMEADQGEAASTG